jgi:hypothetical protein
MLAHLLRRTRCTKGTGTPHGAVRDDGLVEGMDAEATLGIDERGAQHGDCTLVCICGIVHIAFPTLPFSKGED